MHFRWWYSYFRDYFCKYITFVLSHLKICYMWCWVGKIVCQWHYIACTTQHVSKFLCYHINSLWSVQIFLFKAHLSVAALGTVCTILDSHVCSCDFVGFLWSDKHVVVEIAPSPTLPLAKKECSLMFCSSFFAFCVMNVEVRLLKTFFQSSLREATTSLLSPQQFAESGWPSRSQAGCMASCCHFDEYRLSNPAGSTVSVWDYIVRKGNLRIFTVNR